MNGGAQLLILMMTTLSRGNFARHGRGSKIDRWPCKSESMSMSMSESMSMSMSKSMSMSMSKSMSKCMSMSKTLSMSMYESMSMSMSKIYYSTQPKSITEIRLTIIGL